MRALLSATSALVLLAGVSAATAQDKPATAVSPAAPAAADEPAKVANVNAAPVEAQPIEQRIESKPESKAAEPAVEAKPVEAPNPTAAPAVAPAAAEPPKVANVEAAPAAAAATPVTAAPSALSSILKDKLSGPAPKTMSETDKADRAALLAFYSESPAELWVDRAGYNARARAAISEMKRADDWGLRSTDFTVADLAGAAPSDDQRADAELRLSMAILKYARHAKGGRIADPTGTLSTYLDRKPQLLPSRTVLDEVAKASEPDAYLRALHPKHPEFERLRKQLVAVRGGGESKAPIKVPAQGPKLVPGKSHPDVAIVRQRLGVAVPTVDGREDATFFDDALANAVKSFQTEKGIKPASGQIGNGTRAAFNEQPPTINTKKIVASMEHWRWMPAELGDFYVWVNIPEYTVRVVKNGTVIHQERVITGKTDTQTPIFSDKLETVVFHPFWGVPESIKVKEIWPSLVRSGGQGALAKNGLKLQRGGKDVDPASVDWASADIRNFHVYQPPGGGNVLGVVKFLFPNKHQVYMHDTPTKNLFSSTQRTFSHGCMRVRDPVKLAEVILAEDKGWDSKRVQSFVNGGPQNNEIAVKRDIPVHVTYFTARAGEGDKVEAFRDVYGHEERITLALDGKWSQIAKGKDHLAPVKAEPIARLAEGRASAQPQTALGDFFKNLFGGF